MTEKNVASVDIPNEIESQVSVDVTLTEIPEGSLKKISGGVSLTKARSDMVVLQAGHSND